MALLNIHLPEFDESFPETPDDPEVPFDPANPCGPCIGPISTQPSEFAAPDDVSYIHK